MNDRNRKVQSYFHRSAEDWDRLYHKTSLSGFYFNKVFRKALYKRAELALQEILSQGAHSVLDVGCGSGVNSVLFANNGIQRVLGIDYASGMIKIAARDLPEHLKDNVAYQEADFLTWETRESFDCVVALGIFDYLDNPLPFLEKMKALASKSVAFSVPGSGNLRQIVRTVRYRFKRCPLFFYSKQKLENLLTGDGSTHVIQNIGSSGYLGILHLHE